MLYNGQDAKDAKKRTVTDHIDSFGLSWRPWRLGGSLFLFQIVVQVKALDLVYRAPAVEAFDDAGPRDAADLFAQAFIGQQPRQGGDQRMRAAAFDEQAGDAVFDYLGHSADARRDDGAAGGHGFDEASEKASLSEGAAMTSKAASSAGRFST